MNHFARVALWIATVFAVSCSSDLVKNPKEDTPQNIQVSETKFSEIVSVSSLPLKDPRDSTYHFTLEQEQEILKKVVIAAYPHLPAHLKEIARKITFTVDHRRGFTKKFLGWSAEDDLRYRYPDKTLFHIQKSPEGTIHVSFFQKAIQLFAVSLELGEDDPKCLDGIKRISRGVVAHELLHAYQYHTNPVLDLKRGSHLIEDGIAPQHLMDEHRKKIEYEHDSFEVHRKTMGKDLSNVGHLADRIEAYAKKHPEKFKQGKEGIYALVAPGTPNSAVDRYLRATVKTANHGRKFDPTGKVIYYGQLVPAEVVIELSEMDITDEDLKSKVEEQVERYEQYSKNNFWPVLLNLFPYLKEVEERYQKELKRLGAI